jgi:hypothetical protein
VKAGNKKERKNGESCWRLYPQNEIKLQTRELLRRKKKQVSRPLVKGVFQGSGKKRERETNLTRPSGESVKSPEAFIKTKRKKFGLDGTRVYR